MSRDWGPSMGWERILSVEQRSGVIFAHASYDDRDNHLEGAICDMSCRLAVRELWEEIEA